jgi:hypothetical protein
MITRLALYEPPLEFDGITQTAWLPRYERELAAGQSAAALVTIIKGTADRTAFRRLSVALPRARRVTLPGTGHTAPDNSGKPELVAAHPANLLQLAGPAPGTS